jgi:hypothetical protein
MGVLPTLPVGRDIADTYGSRIFKYCEKTFYVSKYTSG